MTERPERLVAHTPMEGSDEWHYLDSHLREVARLAAGFAEPFGGEGFAWWAGIYHDLGKAHPDFQEYLWQSHVQRPRKQKSVDHKTAGALKATEIGGEPLRQILHAHHGGLSDVAELNSKLRAYIDREEARLNLSLERFNALGLTPASEQRDHPPVPPTWFTGDELEMDVLMRMLFSCLVDADGLDTEAHWNQREAAARDVSFPTIEELWARFQADQQAFDERVLQSETANSRVNRVRREIFDSCIEKASLPPGFFRMTVPTGGGKTRSGLAFALKHAVENDLRRVIVAVPFITITEQTADIYTRALGADALIEHHSALEPSRLPRDDDQEGEEQIDALRRQLATQNWDAPLIVTTTVQLFESLFTNRVSQARKLHNIAGSVIILDEIQTLPAHMRAPILDVLHELVQHYNVSVVLSTATQPVLDTITQDLDTGGREIVELAPRPKQVFSELKRVDYEFPMLDEAWSWERAAEEMRTSRQALAIVNTVKDAATLFTALDDDEAIHLSTRMCGAHRRDVLTDIRKRLSNDEPCLVVSTQLVEAGVDLDFPLVLRARGPLDSIVQAAGRCNREGRRASGRVVVFDPEEGGIPKGIYRQGADEARIMLKDPDRDLHDPSTFIDYFTRLYGLADGDRKGIQKRRSERNFATVADEFRMIEDDTFPVMVRYPQVVKDAEQEKAWKTVFHDLQRRERGAKLSLRALLRRAQPWLVSCRYREKDRLLEQGLIFPLVTDVVWEWTGGYDEKIGIIDRRIDIERLMVM